MEMKNETKNKQFDLMAISNNRNIILGVATLLIVLFHSQNLYIEKIFSSKLIENICLFIKSYGAVGVDIFLFLAGFGLYFSYSKNNKISSFYKRRFMRIVPEYIIVVSIIILFKSTNSLKNYLFNISFLALFFDTKCYFWFFSLLVLLYLCYPLIHKLTDRFGKKFILISVIFIIIGNVLLLKYNYNLYARIEIATTRIPSFIIGTYFAYLCKKNFCFPKKALWLVLACFLGLIYIYQSKIFIKHYIMIRFLYCPLAVTIVLLLSFIFNNSKKNIFSNFLIWVGSYSLEIYLLYEFLLKNCTRLFKYKDIYNITYCICIFIITMILSFSLKKFTQEIKDKILS